MISADEPEPVTAGLVPPYPETVASLPVGEATVPADGSLAGPEEAESPVGPASAFSPEGTTSAEDCGHPHRAVRLLSLLLLIVLGLAGVAGGALAFGKELTRKATRAEATAALGKEIATRWRLLPAGKIFPAQIRYLDAQGTFTIATLVGIAPPASCRASLEPRVLQRISAFGCVTMLRATYLDASKTLAATVGIGVMASPSAAVRAFDALPVLKPAGGLYTLPFSGTVADGFGNAQRGAAAVQQTSGPYIFLYTDGYTDGLPGNAAQANPELVLLGQGILSALETKLTGHGAPCTMKDIRC
jgi:hypothetical protein